MRGFTETDETHFESGKLQILVDRRTAAVAWQLVVVSSLQFQTGDKIEAQTQLCDDL